MAIATLPAPHPARGLLVLRRLTLREAARQLAMNEQVLGRQLNGIDRVTPRVRRGLARLLNVAEAQLFYEDEP